MDFVAIGQIKIKKNNLISDGNHIYVVCYIAYEMFLYARKILGGGLPKLD